MDRSRACSDFAGAAFRSLLKNLRAVISKDPSSGHVIPSGGQSVFCTPKGFADRSAESLVGRPPKRRVSWSNNPRKMQIPRRADKSALGGVPTQPRVGAAGRSAGAKIIATLCLILAFGTRGAQAQTINTIAGGGPNNLPALSSSVGTPLSVAQDKFGNLYIATLQDDRVYKVTPAGQLTVVAGYGRSDFGPAGFTGDGGAAASASLNFPLGLSVDGSGNIFVADLGHDLIREVVALTGDILTVAGGGVSLCAGATDAIGDGCAATSAFLLRPWGVSVDGLGNIFIADLAQSRVREVVAATGIIQTVAGNGVAGFSGDGGPATSAGLNGPLGVFVDRTGNIFISEVERIRKVVAATGIIQTVAGNGVVGFSGDGGPATSAELNTPIGVFVDSAGNIFFADSNNNRIREVVAATGSIQTIAGNGVADFNGDGGPGVSASLKGPEGVWADSSGNVFIADSFNNRVREVIVATGSIQTVAGNGTLSSTVDGFPATSTSLNSPESVFVDNAQNLFFVDSGNNSLREVVAATGNIRTAAENGTAGFNLSSGVFVDGAGNIFFADNNRILEVEAATGNTQTVAGNGIAGFSGDGGPATSAELNNPTSVFVDNSANIFFWDAGNNFIREVVAETGKIQTVAGNGPPVFVDSAGNIFFLNFGRVEIGNPPGIILLEVVMATGKIQTVAGSGRASCGGDGGPATSACLSSAAQVFVDSAGNIFIADSSNNNVREVVVATGNIQTVAGNGTFGFVGDGGPATSAEFGGTGGVFVDGSGNIFIADPDNNRIREVVSPVQLSPNALAFPAIAVGTPSGAKNVTLNNMGNTTLAINSITIAGTNGGDFAQTNTCGANVPAGTNCQVSVTFKPTAAGPRSAFVTIIDNPSSSSQTISLSGSGPDFSVAIAQGSSSTATVTAGQTASFSLQLTAAGASQSLLLSCTGAPPQATCMAPTAVSVMLGTPVTVNVVVNTRTNGLLIPTSPLSLLRNPPNRLPILWVFPVLLMLLWMLVRKQAEVRGGRSTWAAWLAFVAPTLLLVMAIAAMSGCGGGSTTTTMNNGTPVGTYTLTVTATASGNLTHTQQLTLTVQ